MTIILLQLFYSIQDEKTDSLLGGIDPCFIGYYCC